MARLFISYRRSDTGAYADRLVARLSAFQFQAIFQDREDIDLADDYADQIRAGLAKCDAVLVLIGPSWTTAQDRAGNKRLDIPNDWVRREVTLALSMGVPIVPVLFDSARTPSAADIPDDLAPLATAQGYDINGNYFDRDADDLARRLEQSIVSRARASSDQTAPVKSGIPDSAPGHLDRALRDPALGLLDRPVLRPGLTRDFWMFPASMAVPAFLYWMYMQGEALRPVRSRTVYDADKSPSRRCRAGSATATAADPGVGLNPACRCWPSGI